MSTSSTKKRSERTSTWYVPGMNRPLNPFESHTDAQLIADVLGKPVHFDTEDITVFVSSNLAREARDRFAENVKAHLWTEAIVDREVQRLLGRQDYIGLNPFAVMYEQGQQIGDIQPGQVLQDYRQGQQWAPFGASSQPLPGAQGAFQKPSPEEQIRTMIQKNPDAVYQMMKKSVQDGTKKEEPIGSNKTTWQAPIQASIGGLTLGDNWIYEGMFSDNSFVRWLSRFAANTLGSEIFADIALGRVQVDNPFYAYGIGGEKMSLSDAMKYASMALRESKGSAWYEDIADYGGMLAGNLADFYLGGVFLKGAGLAAKHLATLPAIGRILTPAVEWGTKVGTVLEKTKFPSFLGGSAAKFAELATIGGAQSAYWAFDEPQYTGLQRAAMITTGALTAPFGAGSVGTIYESGLPLYIAKNVAIDALGGGAGGFLSSVAVQAAQGNIDWEAVRQSTLLGAGLSIGGGMLGRAGESIGFVREYGRLVRQSEQHMETYLAHAERARKLGIDGAEDFLATVEGSIEALKKERFKLKPEEYRKVYKQEKDKVRDRMVDMLQKSGIGEQFHQETLREILYDILVDPRYKRTRETAKAIFGIPGWSDAVFKEGALAATAPYGIVSDTVPVFGGEDNIASQLNIQDIPIYYSPTNSSDAHLAGTHHQVGKFDQGVFIPTTDDKKLLLLNRIHEQFKEAVKDVLDLLDADQRKLFRETTYKALALAIDIAQNRGIETGGGLLLVVGPPKGNSGFLMKAYESFANFLSSNYGLDVKVVTPEQVKDTDVRDSVKKEIEATSILMNQIVELSAIEQKLDTIDPARTLGALFLQTYAVLNQALTKKAGGSPTIDTRKAKVVAGFDKYDIDDIAKLLTTISVQLDGIPYSAVDGSIRFYEHVYDKEAGIFSAVTTLEDYAYNNYLFARRLTTHPLHKETLSKVALEKIAQEAREAKEVRAQATPTIAEELPASQSSMTGSLPSPDVPIAGSPPSTDLSVAALPSASDMGSVESPPPSETQVPTQDIPTSGEPTAGTGTKRTREKPKAETPIETPTPTKAVELDLRPIEERFVKVEEAVFTELVEQHEPAIIRAADNILTASSFEEAKKRFNEALAIIKSIQDLVPRSMRQKVITATGVDRELLYKIVTKYEAKAIKTIDKHVANMRLDSAEAAATSLVQALSRFAETFDVLGYTDDAVRLKSGAQKIQDRIDRGEYRRAIEEHSKEIEEYSGVEEEPKVAEEAEAPEATEQVEPQEYKRKRTRKYEDKVARDAQKWIQGRLFSISPVIFAYALLSEEDRKKYGPILLGGLAALALTGYGRSKYFAPRNFSGRFIDPSIREDIGQILADIRDYHAIIRTRDLLARKSTTDLAIAFVNEGKLRNDGIPVETYIDELYAQEEPPDAVIFYRPSTGGQEGAGEGVAGYELGSVTVYRDIQDIDSKPYTGFGSHALISQSRAGDNEAIREIDKILGRLVNDDSSIENPTGRGTFWEFIQSDRRIKQNLRRLDPQEGNEWQINYRDGKTNVRMRIAKEDALSIAESDYGLVYVPARIGGVSESGQTISFDSGDKKALLFVDITKFNILPSERGIRALLGTQLPDDIPVIIPYFRDGQGKIVVAPMSRIPLEATRDIKAGNTLLLPLEGGSGKHRLYFKLTPGGGGRVFSNQYLYALLRDPTLPPGSWYITVSSPFIRSEKVATGLWDRTSGRIPYKEEIFSDQVAPYAGKPQQAIQSVSIHYSVATKEDMSKLKVPEEIVLLSGHRGFLVGDERGIPMGEGEVYLSRSDKGIEGYRIYLDTKTGHIVVQLLTNYNTVRDFIGEFLPSPSGEKKSYPPWFFDTSILQSEKFQQDILAAIKEANRLELSSKVYANEGAWKGLTKTDMILEKTRLLSSPTALNDLYPDEKGALYKISQTIRGRIETSLYAGLMKAADVEGVPKVVWEDQAMEYLPWRRDTVWAAAQTEEVRALSKLYEHHRLYSQTIYHPTDRYTISDELHSLPVGEVLRDTNSWMEHIQVYLYYALHGPEKLYGLLRSNDPDGIKKELSASLNELSLEERTRYRYVEDLVKAIREHADKSNFDPRSILIFAPDLARFIVGETATGRLHGLRRYTRFVSKDIPFITMRSSSANGMIPLVSMDYVARPGSTRQHPLYTYQTSALLREHFRFILDATSEVLKGKIPEDMSFAPYTDRIVAMLRGDFTSLDVKSLEHDEVLRVMAEIAAMTTRHVPSINISPDVLSYLRSHIIVDAPYILRKYPITEFYDRLLTHAEHVERMGRQETIEGKVLDESWSGPGESELVTEEVHIDPRKQFETGEEDEESPTINAVTYRLGFDSRRATTLEGAVRYLTERTLSQMATDEMVKANVEYLRERYWRYTSDIGKTMESIARSMTNNGEIMQKKAEFMIDYANKVKENPVAAIAWYWKNWIMAQILPDTKFAKTVFGAVRSFDWLGRHGWGFVYDGWVHDNIKRFGYLFTTLDVTVPGNLSEAVSDLFKKYEEQYGDRLRAADSEEKFRIALEVFEQIEPVLAAMGLQPLYLNHFTTMHNSLIYASKVPHEELTGTLLTGIPSIHAKDVETPLRQADVEGYYEILRKKIEEFGDSPNLWRLPTIAVRIEEGPRQGIEVIPRRKAKEMESNAVSSALDFFTRTAFPPGLRNVGIEYVRDKFDKLTTLLGLSSGELPTHEQVAAYAKTPVTRNEWERIRDLLEDVAVDVRRKIALLDDANNRGYSELFNEAQTFFKRIFWDLPSVLKYSGVSLEEAQSSTRVIGTPEEGIAGTMWHDLFSEKGREGLARFLAEWIDEQNSWESKAYYVEAAAAGAKDEAVDREAAMRYIAVHSVRMLESFPEVPSASPSKETERYWGEVAKAFKVKLAKNSPTSIAALEKICKLLTGNDADGKKMAQNIVQDIARRIGKDYLDKFEGFIALHREYVQKTIDEATSKIGIKDATSFAEFGKYWEVPGYSSHRRYVVKKGGAGTSTIMNAPLVRSVELAERLAGEFADVVLAAHARFISRSNQIKESVARLEAKARESIVKVQRTVPDAKERKHYIEQVKKATESGIHRIATIYFEKAIGSVLDEVFSPDAILYQWARYYNSKKAAQALDDGLLQRSVAEAWGILSLGRSLDDILARYQGYYDDPSIFSIYRYPAKQGKTSLQSEWLKTEEQPTPATRKSHRKSTRKSHRKSTRKSQPEEPPVSVAQKPTHDTQERLKFEEEEIASEALFKGRFGRSVRTEEQPTPATRKSQPEEPPVSVAQKPTPEEPPPPVVRESRPEEPPPPELPVVTGDEVPDEVPTPTRDKIHYKPGDWELEAGKNLLPFKTPRNSSGKYEVARLDMGADGQYVFLSELEAYSFYRLWETGDPAVRQKANEYFRSVNARRASGERINSFDIYNYSNAILRERSLAGKPQEIVSGGAITSPVYLGLKEEARAIARALLLFARQSEGVRARLRTLAQRSAAGETPIPIVDGHNPKLFVSIQAREGTNLWGKVAAWLAENRGRYTGEDSSIEKMIDDLGRSVERNEEVVAKNQRSAGLRWDSRMVLKEFVSPLILAYLLAEDEDFRKYFGGIGLGVVPLMFLARKGVRTKVGRLFSSYANVIDTAGLGRFTEGTTKSERQAAEFLENYRQGQKGLPEKTTKIPKYAASRFALNLVLSYFILPEIGEELGINPWTTRTLATLGWVGYSKFMFNRLRVARYAPFSILADIQHFKTDRALETEAALELARIVEKSSGMKKGSLSPSVEAAVKKLSRDTVLRRAMMEFIHGGSQPHPGSALNMEKWTDEQWESFFSLAAYESRAAKLTDLQGLFRTRNPIFVALQAHIARNQMRLGELTYLADSFKLVFEPPTRRYADRILDMAEADREHIQRMAAQRGISLEKAAFEYFGTQMDDWGAVGDLRYIPLRHAAVLLWDSDRKAWSDRFVAWWRDVPGDKKTFERVMERNIEMDKLISDARAHIHRMEERGQVDLDLVKKYRDLEREIIDTYESQIYSDPDEAALYVAIRDLTDISSRIYMATTIFDLAGIREYPGLQNISRVITDFDIQLAEERKNLEAMKESTETHMQNMIPVQEMRVKDLEQRKAQIDKLLQMMKDTRERRYLAHFHDKDGDFAVHWVAKSKSVSMEGKVETLERSHIRWFATRKEAERFLANLRKQDILQADLIDSPEAFVTMATSLHDTTPADVFADIQTKLFYNTKRERNFAEKVIDIIRMRTGKPPHEKYETLKKELSETLTGFVQRLSKATVDDTEELIAALRNTDNPILTKTADSIAEMGKEESFRALQDLAKKIVSTGAMRYAEGLLRSQHSEVASALQSESLVDDLARVYNDYNGVSETWKRWNIRGYEPGWTNRDYHTWFAEAINKSAGRASTILQRNFMERALRQAYDLFRIMGVGDRYQEILSNAIENVSAMSHRRLDTSEKVGLWLRQLITMGMLSMNVSSAQMNELLAITEHAKNRVEQGIRSGQYPISTRSGGGWSDLDEQVNNAMHLLVARGLGRVGRLRVDEFTDARLFGVQKDPVLVNRGIKIVDAFARKTGLTGTANFLFDGAVQEWAEIAANMTIARSSIKRYLVRNPGDVEGAVAQAITDIWNAQGFASPLTMHEWEGKILRSIFAPVTSLMTTSLRLLSQEFGTIHNVLMGTKSFDRKKSARYVDIMSYVAARLFIGSLVGVSGTRLFGDLFNIGLEAWDLITDLTEPEDEETTLKQSAARRFETANTALLEKHFGIEHRAAVAIARWIQYGFFSAFGDVFASNANITQILSAAQYTKFQSVKQAIDEYRYGSGDPLKSLQFLVRTVSAFAYRATSALRQMGVGHYILGNKDSGIPYDIVDGIYELLNGKPGTLVRATVAARNGDIVLETPHDRWVFIERMRDWSGVNIRTSTPYSSEAQILLDIYNGKTDRWVYEIIRNKDFAELFFRELLDRYRYYAQAYDLLTDKEKESLYQFYYDNFVKRTMSESAGYGTNAEGDFRKKTNKLERQAYAALALLDLLYSPSSAEFWQRTWKYQTVGQQIATMMVNGGITDRKEIMDRLAPARWTSASGYQNAEHLFRAYTAHQAGVPAPRLPREDLVAQVLAWMQRQWELKYVGPESPVGKYESRIDKLMGMDNIYKELGIEKPPRHRDPDQKEWIQEPAYVQLYQRPSAMRQLIKLLQSRDTNR